MGSALALPDVVGVHVVSWVVISSSEKDDLGNLLGIGSTL